MAASPPTGAVTLVFTDVQGSTRLWERHPDAMRLALALHDRVMRDAIAAAGGYEVKTEGDAFMIAFADPVSAVNCCLAAQAGLLAAAWPDEILHAESAAEERSASGALLHRGLRVRMGAHGGEPECRVDPTTGRMDYFGPVVNRAARINSSGHGGQILLSERVWRAVEPRLAELGTPPPVAADLGEHRLKDLEEVERLFQVLPAAVEGRRFAPPRTLDVRKTNLIPHPTDFVGREKDLAAVHALFSGGDRLVTLMGPGGTGKTRISMRYAALHLDEFARDGGGGVWFCELVDTRDVDDICAVVAGALEVPLTAGKSAAEMVAHLGRAMHGRGRVLVILDNFEQVVAHAGDTIAAWMKAAPEARFLVASQERLRLPGEKTYEVAPLSLPEAAGSIAASEAVQLFVHRARSVRPDYVLSDADAPAVGEIVKELDGIPLAIELAAARMGVLSPAKLLERLPRRFDLLGGARRDATARQSTLRGAIDWSWNLLQPHEQDALGQCSVFAGGFSLDAAEEVVDLSSHEGAPWPMDAIQSLRDKSLLRAWEPKDFPGELRFGMYSNIREYAAEKLKGGPNAVAAAERHAAWYLREGKAWKDGVDRHDGLQKLRRLALELENLIAVFQRAVAVKPATKEAATRALDAIQIVDPLLSTRGPFGTHLGWLTEALSTAENAGVPAASKAAVLVLRGRALRVRGKAVEALADFRSVLSIADDLRSVELEALGRLEIGFTEFERGRYAEARATFDFALPLAKRVGAPQVEGRAHVYLGGIDGSEGRIAEARAHYDEAVAIFTKIGNRRLEGAVLGNLGILLRQQGRLEEARESYLRALETYRTLGERIYEGNTLGSLGNVELELGRQEEAASHFEQSLAIHRQVGNLRSEGIFLGNLGVLEFERGRLDAAQAHFRAATEKLAEVGDRRPEGLYLGYLAAVQVELGRIEEAASSFKEAATRLDPRNDALLCGVVEVLKGFLDHAERRTADAEARIVKAESAEGGEALVQRSADARLAIRILRSSLAR